MTPVRLEPAALQSRVKHSTTEEWPLKTGFTVMYFSVFFLSFCGSLSFSQPPPDLHLRDPVYTGSPSQGYNSPTGSGNKGKQPNRGQPLKPPHRLNDNLPPQR